MARRAVFQVNVRSHGGLLGMPQSTQVADLQHTQERNGGGGGSTREGTGDTYRAGAGGDTKREATQKGIWRPWHREEDG